jgi:hypothetical protein
MVTDAQRRSLYDELVRTHGQEHADTMMDLLPPVGWNDVARRSDIAELRGELRSQMARLAWTNFVSMIGLAGLVLAAAKLA